eukprot:1184475-Prorocentrum_minimum.AAC.5
MVRRRRRSIIAVSRPTPEMPEGIRALDWTANASSRPDSTSSMDTCPADWTDGVREGGIYP